MLVTAAVRSEIREIPIIISIPPTIFPVLVVGTASPYPTVVTVCRAHQNASPNRREVVRIGDPHDDSAHEREDEKRCGQPERP